MRRVADMRIAKGRRLVVPLVIAGALVAGDAGSAAAATPTRILYATDWAGPTQIFAADPSGRSSVSQLTTNRTKCETEPLIACGFVDPVPSPDGRHFLYRTVGVPPPARGGGIWLGGKGRPVRLAPGGGFAECTRCPDPEAPYAAWTRDSRRVAYAAGDGLHVARSDGSGDRIVGPADSTSPSWDPTGRALAFVDGGEVMILKNGRVRPLGQKCAGISWSANGRWLACSVYGYDAEHRKYVFDVTLLNAKGQRVASLGSTLRAPSWAPTGTRIAFARPDGAIDVVDAATRRGRMWAREPALSLAWAPDGRSIAYLAGEVTEDTVSTGPLRTVTAAGSVRTIVPAGRGHVVAVAWTRAGTGTRGSPPVGTDGLLASGEVDALATAGDRVAYLACGRAYVWAPPEATPRELAQSAADSSGPAGACHPGGEWRFGMEAIALGPGAALVGQCGTCPMTHTDVHAIDLSGTGPDTVVGSGNGRAAATSGSGTLVGDGSLLVFSSWKHAHDGDPAVSEQHLFRLDGGACPCAEVTSADGPLQPLDVDSRRVLAERRDSISVLTQGGDTSLTIRVRPLAAQLTANAVVVTVPHELRVYDARDGTLVHAWALPDVSSGRDCQGWFDPGCQDDPALSAFGFCAGGDSSPCPTLRLQDAGHGLAAYILDGRLHLLRLTDGADTDVAYATAARFTDTGLVYADGARLHLVGLNRLPQ